MSTQERGKPVERNRWSSGSETRSILRCPRRETEGRFRQFRAEIYSTLSPWNMRSIRWQFHPVPKVARTNPHHRSCEEAE